MRARKGQRPRCGPGLCLICGTSLEQIPPESLTLCLSGFVHDYVWVAEQVGSLLLVWGQIEERH
jgi:hypothetical protein